MNEKYLINYEENMPNGENWIFIIGTSSTGTTVLTEILNRHPDICILNEGWLLGYIQLMFFEEINLRQITSETDCFNKNIICKIKNRSLHKQLIQNYQISKNEIPYVFIRKILEGLRSAIAPNKMFFGDKYGIYRNYLKEINYIFPDCKLLLTTRNLWDQVASLYDSDWYKCLSWYNSADVSNETTIIKKLISKVLNIKKENEKIINTYNINVIDFDKMATHSEQEIKNTLSYLNLNYELFNFDILEDTRYNTAVNHYLEIPKIVELKHDIESKFDINNNQEEIIAYLGV